MEPKRRRLSRSEREKVYQKCLGHCAYCGCALDYKDMQVDHVKPLRVSGSDEISNMLPTCRSCNHYKAIPTDAISRCEPFCWSMPLTEDYIERCEMEVVGNIFDNSELLQEESDE